MMGTRAAAFAGKISNLRESILRIQNGTMPQPTCIDLANMMRYFCQVLHDFRDFKDIENIPLYASEKKDRMQLIKTLPNFDYCGLYKTLTQLVDILPLIPQSSNGLDQLGSGLLMLFKCLVPFLDQANMETMPFLVTTLFMSLPQSLHKDILDTLCFNLLPFTIDQQHKSSSSSSAAVGGGGGGAAMLNKAKQRGRKQPSQQASQQPATFLRAEQGSVKKPEHCIVRIEDPSYRLQSPDIIGAADGSTTIVADLTEPTTAQQQHRGDSLEDQGIGLEADVQVVDGNNIISGSDEMMESEEEEQEQEYALLSVTSILMIAFHYITEQMHHSQLVECLMKLKSNVFEDLLYVIAYGTTRARCPAVEILFRYWPDVCPSQQDRKNNSQASKLKHISWQPTKCQNKNCSLTTLGDDEAVKMCLDFKISITLSDLPPPMLVCLDCVDSIYKQQLASGSLGDETLQVIDDYSSKFIDLLLPMERVSKLCENKKCKSTDRSAIGTCFDIECANYNCKKPIRYCKTCFVSIHEPCKANNYDESLQNHIRHSSCKLTIMDNEESINNFVEAIISLLKEAAPADRPSKDSERYLRSLMGPMSQFNIDNKDMSIATEEKQLISQYGIWLMTGLCKTVDRLSDELLGRLLGMLFQWFHFTACLPDDQAGSALEKLKGECIKGWIMGVKNERLDVFISCLLPHPIDCSKIGGHWEVWPDTAHQIKEGFKRLLCLVPYDIITDDVWDVIMPHWMECFRHEVPENELSELKILLSKVFDPELSPLGFETKQMYNFISSRFEDPCNTKQEQTLYWLQIITMLEIPIPIEFLFQMMKSGVKSLASIRNNELTKIKIANRLAGLDKLPSGQSDASSLTSASRSSMSSAESSAGEEGGSPNGRRRRRQHRRQHRRGRGRRSSSGSESPVSNALSMAEDDVILPASQEPSQLDQLAGSKAAASDQQTNASSLQPALASSQPIGGSPSQAGQQPVGPSSPQAPLTQQERQAQARAAFSARLAQQASILDAQARGAAPPAAGQPQVVASGGAASAQVAQAASSSSPLSLAGAVAQTKSSPGAATPAGLPASSQAGARPLKSSSAGGVSSSGGGGGGGGGATSATSATSATRSLGAKTSSYSSSQQAATASASQASKTTPDSKSAQQATGSSQRPKLRLQMSSVEEYLTNKIDNNLVCYILMLDILLKQLDLQEVNSHRGLDGKEAQQAIELLNTIISTPWIGRHTCCDSLPHNSSGSPTQASSASSQSAAANQKAATAAGGAGAAGGPLTKTQRAESPSIASPNVHSFGHCAQGFEHEEAYETCVFCEIISTFHQLAMFLIEFFSPVIEVSICEVSQDAANGEFDGKPDYSRVGLDHLDPSPRDLDGKFSFETQTLLQQQQQQNQLYQQDPTSPFSPSYFGPSLKPEVLNSLPKELQLAYNLLVHFHQYQTPDIVSQLLQMIKLISLHSQVLSKAAKNNPEFITWCQHNMLVNKLWSLCQLESSEIARTCVPLLLHCITLPWGVRLFRDLVERDFNSENWLSRFRAVERVVTIAYFCEPSTIKNSTLLQSTMASAFCYVVRCLDDIEAIVAQRALVSLEMMKTSSLKLLLWCLEVQFDCIIVDRPIILRSVFQLYNHLRDRRFLTWEFFLNRFDTIFLEAQIYLQQTGEIPSFTMQDLKNTNTKSEIYQKKITRAREALHETHHPRSLSSRFKEKQFSNSGSASAAAAAAGAAAGATGASSSSSAASKPTDDLRKQYKQSVRLQRQMQQQQQQHSISDATGGGCSTSFDNSKQATKLIGPDDAAAAASSSGKGGQLIGADKRRAISPTRKVLQHGKSTSSRYQSIAFLTSQSMVGRKNSKFMTNLAMQSVPPLMLPDKLHQHLPNSFVDDGSKLNEIAQENHVFGVVHRVCDEDRDTNHSLIFLFMQFLSKPDPSHPQSVKTLNRSHQIVLRHLNILMGYSVARKNFLIAATNLRLLPVFNAFLTSIPKVLDFNYSLGTIILDTCLPVLIYCPAPDDTQYDSIRIPSYSLWLLNPLMRQSWLMSVMTFLYKYQFGQAHLKEHVNMLMWIVINTLESHLNCSTAEAALDRCLINIRDSSTATGSAGAQETPVASSSGQASAAAAAATADEHASRAAHSVGGGGGSQEHSLTHQAAAVASTLVVDSPSRGGGGHTIEVIEMTSTGGAKEEASGKAATATATPTASPFLLRDANKMAPSTSSGSLRHGGGGGGGGGDGDDALASSEHSFTAKSLIKADTSDSLNVKAKLFQRKLDAPSLAAGKPQGGVTATNSATNSSTRINMEPAEPVGVASSKAMEQQQQQQQQAAPATVSTAGDERLLPIGIHQPQKTRSTFDLPAAERLLPIGYNPVHSPSSGGLHKAGEQSAAQPMRAHQQRTSLVGQKEEPKGSSSPSCVVKLTGDEFKETQPGGEKHAPPMATGATSALVHPSSSTSAASDSTSARAATVQQQQQHRAAPTAADKDSSEVEPSPSSGKADRRRFGAKLQHKQEQQQQQETNFACGEPSTSKASTSGTFGGVRKNKGNKLVKEYIPKQVNTVQPSFSSPSLLNEQLALINRHSFVQEFSDKDLSMCLVILETFIHHEPSMAAQMLPNILRLVARYSSASLDSWQSGSNVHLVGGSMFVARQFIRVALHDLMENNIFHQIFTSHFTGYEFYKSMATALADFSDLNQLAPLSKLFEDLNKQKNLPQAGSLMTILENVATYFECIIAESTNHSQATWTNFINNWENFLRKLILALPRYSGSTMAAASGGGSSGRADGGSSSIVHASNSNRTALGQPNSSAGANLGQSNHQFSSNSRGAGGGQENANITSANAIPSSCSMIMVPIMRIVLSTSKISRGEHNTHVPLLASCKTIVDPYSKIISYTVLNSQFKYEHLLEINHNCCRLYTRDREKYLIQRTIAYELVQVLKFRFFILEENLLILLLFILQDVGGTLAPKVVRDSLKIDQIVLNQAESYVTNVSECLRQYIGDLLEFITDVHAISRINDNLIGAQPSSINRDSFGGHVKAAISQYLALEMSLTNGGDNRTVLRYLPWLYTSPSLQQGPREFIDCVSHIRQLSWIILGSLQHSTLMKDQHSGNHNLNISSSSNNNNNINSNLPSTSSSSGGQHSTHINCQPIPIEKNGKVAEHVQVILAGFAEQSKESVLHMSGLFHAFLLCQLWTMYCENICNLHTPASEQYQFCQSTLDDFWAKITPGVLRLVGHSRVMSEMVSTHFLQLIESLIESNSSILIRYLPMWNSVFYSYKRRNKSGNLAIRLQKCIEWQPPDLNEQDVEQNNKRLMNWLEKVQYKMSHIEIQSSQAAPFYLT